MPKLLRLQLLLLPLPLLPRLLPKLLPRLLPKLLLRLPPKLLLLLLLPKQSIKPYGN